MQFLPAHLVSSVDEAFFAAPDLAGTCEVTHRAPPFENRLPGMFQAKENVAAGGFMAYGASVPDLFRRAAGYARRILQGTKPADLPVKTNQI